MAEVGHRIGDVVRYRDREMSPEEARDFEVHLATCPDCADALRAAEAALSTFDELVGGRAPPLDLDAAMARVRRGEAAARADRRRVRLVAAVGFAIAAGILVAVALFVSRPRAPPPRQEIVKVPPAKAKHALSAPAPEPLAEPTDGGG